jgi:hypothetical protein
MLSPFIQPRFVGERFNEHTLPLDVTKDMHAYQTLVVELAKHLYLKEHPHRQRVPKGFETTFELHIAKVDTGSAKPLLMATMGAAMALDLEANTYFERSRDIITECIAAKGALPAEFPKELLIHFNQIGRSLRSDESMELDTAAGEKATLTPTRRKDLVLALAKVYDRPTHLTGYIDELDFTRGTFRMRQSDGSTVNVPMPEHFEPLARVYAGKPRHHVFVQCIASFDSFDKLQKVVDLEHLDIQPNSELVARFDALQFLEDGWFDGVGKAPNKEGLAEVADHMVKLYPEHLALPAIVPTPEGDLLLEWRQKGMPSVDIDLSAMQVEFHAIAPDGDDIVRNATLTDDADWLAFFKFLSNHIEEVSP